MKGDKCSHFNCEKIAIGYMSCPHEGLNVCEDHAPAKEPYNRERFSGKRVVWWDRFILYEEE